MSFLDNNNSEYLSARITQKGRNSIAKGDFVISYFAIGDSEYVYTNPFSGLTGSGTIPNQKVFSPFDKDTQIKYPLKMDDTPLSGTTIYGIPIQDSITESVRNVMGPAGFVSNYKPYSLSTVSGTTVECLTNLVSFSGLTGSTQITVPIASGTTYQNCEYVSLVFNEFHVSGGTYNFISGQSASLVYKIISVVTGTTSEVLTLDRPTPDLSSLSGYTNVVCNSCDLEFPNVGDVDNTCLPVLPLNEAQHNPWKLNVTWSESPIGFNVSTIDQSISGFTSSKHISTKEFLGYNTSLGQLYNTGTTYNNTYLEEILVLPEEQKCIAIIHYSEVGDIINDPDRYYKYDDYISSDTSTSNMIAKDIYGDDISDNEYFEVYIPFINYHRNTGSTIGATFHMSITDKFVISKINDRLHIKYRDLLDEQGYRVGKVFVDNKTIVFDDQELVAVLDYKSNRKYTLPAPKLNLLPDDYINPSDSIMTGSTGQTMWITYTFENTDDDQLNGLPCNYFSKVVGINTPSSVTVKFNSGEFSNMYDSSSYIDQGFVANKFYILAQLVTTGNLPNPSSWKKIDFTGDVSPTIGPAINPSEMVNKTFIIDKAKYNTSNYSPTILFDLTTHMGVDFTDSNVTNFGDEQPFPGSVKLVRSSDFETMKFLVNLPSSKFTGSQNPTYTTGNPYITEVALLNSNKEALAIAKTSKPLTRTGTQVFAVKLDF